MERIVCPKCGEMVADYLAFSLHHCSPPPTPKQRQEAPNVAEFRDMIAQARDNHADEQPLDWLARATYRMYGLPGDPLKFRKSGA